LRAMLEQTLEQADSVVGEDEHSRADRSSEPLPEVTEQRSPVEVTESPPLEVQAIASETSSMSPTKESFAPFFSGEDGDSTQPKKELQFSIDDDEGWPEPLIEVPLSQAMPSGSTGSLPLNTSMTDSSGEVPEMRKFQWLCPADQKTVCRRSCQKAQEREAALVNQIQKTIAAYRHGIQVATYVGGNEKDGLGPVVDAQVLSKYEERIRLLRGTLAALEAEHTVTFPRLDMVEKTKGFIYNSYAQTAQVVKDIADSAGATQPVVRAVNNAKTAVMSLPSKLLGEVPGTGGATGGYTGESMGGVGSPMPPSRPN